jgi:serine/threonine-protein kinase
VQLLREIVLEPLPLASARAAEYGLADRLPPGFDAWFASCVAREPSARFADAAALWGALPGVLASAPSSLAAPGVEALAATNVAPMAGSVALPGEVLLERGISTETGAASPFVPSPPGQAVSAPPFEAAQRTGERVRPETPIATVQDRDATGHSSSGAARAPAQQKNDRRVLVLGVIATVAVAVAILSVARSHTMVSPVMTAVSLPPSASAIASSAPVTSAAPSSDLTAAAMASAVPSAAPPAPPSTTRDMPLKPSATGSSLATAAPSASAPPKPRAALPGGFSDPTDRNGAVTTKVQDRHVRLFVRLVSNESNVADAVVRKAIEWSSWEYLRCYERIFHGAKDLPEGTLSVGFDILDQLPRHAKLVSSTFESAAFNDCVVRTLVGQTINAAGPDGKGHAVEGFRFVPN